MDADESTVLSETALNGLIAHVVVELTQIDVLRDMAKRLGGEDAVTLQRIAHNLDTAFEMRLMVMRLDCQDPARKVVKRYRSIHPHTDEPQAPLDWTEIEAELAQKKTASADFELTVFTAMWHAAVNLGAANEAKARHQAELDRMPPLTRAYALKAIERFNTKARII